MALYVGTTGPRTTTTDESGERLAARRLPEGVAGVTALPNWSHSTPPTRAK